MADRGHGDLVADFVIVGGGSAGLVLANRLSADPRNRVLLIEAGGSSRDALVQVPVGYARMVNNPRYDWRYEQEPDPTIEGRHFAWAAGRMLGGGSSLNGQVYIRGTRADYDHWAESGATGWSFDEVFPYFLRSEDWAGKPGPAHGQGGPLTVSPMRSPHPLCHAFLAGCAEIGVTTLDDFNGGDAEGAFLAEVTQRRGWRCSTEKAYLRPARNRANLDVQTGAEGLRIIHQDGAAIGVEFRRDGLVQRAMARREVIASAGTVGSPALLMRSGLGKAEAISDHGIDVWRDIPGVGENLQEHSAAGQNKYVNRPTMNSEVGPLHMVGHALAFALSRRGAFTAPAVQAMALVRTDAAQSEPDIQLHFQPLIFDLDPEKAGAAALALPKEPAVSINATNTRPLSRGRVALGPDGAPRVVHRLFDDERDLASLVRGMKLIDRIFATPTFRALVIRDRNPRPVPTDDAGWSDYVREKAGISYHPVGTCRMGLDDRAVVDAKLRVRGVGNLRVVDASIMPRITSANTNAPTIMIAEKAADLILAG